MKIEKVEERTPELIQELVAVWESSVRATHLFLSDPEVKKIKEYVPEAIGQVPLLFVAYSDEGPAVAFMGIDGESLEMLFVAAECRGQGVGRALLVPALEQLGVRELAVNEQNPQAVGFYEHLGFEVFKRTDVDQQGDPYPLLYMRLP